MSALIVSKSCRMNSAIANFPSRSAYEFSTFNRLIVDAQLVGFHLQPHTFCTACDLPFPPNRTSTRTLYNVNPDNQRCRCVSPILPTAYPIQRGDDSAVDLDLAQPFGTFSSGSVTYGSLEGCGIPLNQSMCNSIA